MKQYPPNSGRAGAALYADANKGYVPQDGDPRYGTHRRRPRRAIDGMVGATRLLWINAVPAEDPAQALFARCRPESPNPVLPTDQKTSILICP